MLLSEVKRNENVIVQKIESEGLFKKRLMDFGIIEETIIKVVGFAPLGDPIILEFNGSKIALRKSDAKKILVKETK